jgi:hypothetical protein
MNFVSECISDEDKAKYNLKNLNWIIDRDSGIFMVASANKTKLDKIFELYIDDKLIKICGRYHKSEIKDCPKEVNKNPSKELIIKFDIYDLIIPDFFREQAKEITDILKSALTRYFISSQMEYKNPIVKIILPEEINWKKEVQYMMTNLEYGII